jgi:predicted RNA binding protein YcfA (HicA-like mRNA interferase family)
VSGRDVVRALERLGFEQRRQRGSHVVLRRQERGCVVPLHKDLKTGTLAGLLRQADITAEEFLAALER